MNQLIKNEDILRQIEFIFNYVFNDFKYKRNKYFNRKELNKLKRVLKTDLEALRVNDPSVRNVNISIYTSTSFYAIFLYRLANNLLKRGYELEAKVLSSNAISVSGIDINPNATIGPYFFIDHGVGVVIGETCVLGSGVSLYQNVTLGAIGLNMGFLLKDTKRHPTLEDNVTVYSNSTILGNIRIEKNTTISNNCTIITDISSNMIVFSNGEMIKKKFNTPLLRLQNTKKYLKTSNTFYAKLEYFNEFKSIKDRGCHEMMKDLNNQGLITKNSILGVVSSGNMGISLAGYCLNNHLKCVIFMPLNASKERVEVIKSLNGSVVLYGNNISECLEYAKKRTDILFLDQFENKIIRLGGVKLAFEIYKELRKIDIFVCSIGTGGTISGAGHLLKVINPKVKIIGIEPKQSPLISKGYYKSHKVVGVSPNIIPKVLDLSVIDKIILIDENKLYKGLKKLKRLENIEVGFSSVFNYLGMLHLNRTVKNKVIVTVFNDDLSKYMSLIDKLPR